MLVTYRGVDARTGEHSWGFTLAGNSDSEDISSETLATILDLQWETPQLVGFVRPSDAAQIDVWLYRGHYVSVDNADAHRQAVIDAITRDPRFQAPLDEDVLRALRAELPENRFQREEREAAEQEAQEEARLAELGPRRRLAIPQHVRHDVWRRDQGRCVECGSREKLEYDHTIPLSLGGSNTARNLRLLCEPCNRRKSAHI
jgi:hypothetical protein